MRTPAFVALALAFGLAWGADAPPRAAPAWPEALSGRLEQIRQTRLVRLGYRENAVPFSYLGPDGKPIGYSLDVCHAIVATIAEELDEPALGVAYVRVTATDRIERVVSGAVDLECGSTTSTAERRRQAAFSPVVFVTGTRLAVPSGSSIRGVNDLRGRPVAVVRSTTNEAAMREVDRLRGLAMTFVAAGDYRAALALVAEGNAEALAADEVLLRGLLAETGRAREFRIVGEMLSFEPYGIMYPRDDPALADVVARTFRTLAESREIVWLYNRWFVRPLPGGRSIGMPMSVELRRSFELIGLPPE
jgi:glutamate/aspartate transport system substrate-binding protein